MIRSNCLHCKGCPLTCSCVVEVALRALWQDSQLESQAEGVGAPLCASQGVTLAQTDSYAVLTEELGLTDKSADVPERSPIPSVVQAVQSSFRGV